MSFDNARQFEGVGQNRNGTDILSEENPESLWQFPVMVKYARQIHSRIESLGIRPNNCSGRTGIASGHGIEGRFIGFFRNPESSAICNAVVASADAPAQKPKLREQLGRQIDVAQPVKWGDTVTAIVVPVEELGWVQAGKPQERNIDCTHMLRLPPWWREGEYFALLLVKVQASDKKAYMRVVRFRQKATDTEYYTISSPLPLLSSTI